MSDFKKLRILDIDKLYDNTLVKRLINVESTIGKKLTPERLEQLIYNVDAALGFVASCECQKFKGNFYLGHKCPCCGTIVQSQFTDDLSHINWIELPEFLPSFIHPALYRVLTAWMGKAKYPKMRSNIAMMSAILDPTLDLPMDIRSHISGQGFSYFEQNFDTIMDFFINVYPPTKKNRDTVMIKYIYENYKELFFIRRLPLLNPSLTPQGKEGRAKVVDKTTTYVLNAITNLSSLTFNTKRSITNKKYIDSMMCKIFADIVAYTENIITEKFGEKFAHARRHMVGTRVHWSARTVIVPIVEPHTGDEVHIPWKMALGAFKLEILNLLTNRTYRIMDPETLQVTRRAYTHAEALEKYSTAMVVFDQTIYDILMTLMKESPDGVFRIIGGRNPTLRHGNIMLFRVTKIKRDVHDETIGISPRICKAPNADFD